MSAPVDGRRIAVSTHSGEARALLAQGRLAAFHYRFDVARRHLDAAIAADPELALARIYRGGSAEEEDPARRPAFDRALALRHLVTAGERGLIDAFRLFLLHDDHDHAMAIFRELADAYPDDAFPPGHLALRLLYTKRSDEAVEQFERARERDPEFTPHAIWLGRALVRCGRIGEAEEVFLAVLQSFPDDANGHYAAGAFYAAQKRLDEAERRIGRALELEPEYGEAREALAKLAEQGKA